MKAAGGVQNAVLRKPPLTVTTLSPYNKNKNREGDEMRKWIREFVEIIILYRLVKNKKYDIVERVTVTPLTY